MRLRLVLPVLGAAGLTIFATLISHGLATDHGAYEGGPLAWVGAGLYVLWPAVVLVGVLAGVVPHLLGERQAALWAGAVMVLLAVLGIGAGSAWGTRDRAAMYPTTPACAAPEGATEAEAASIEELEQTLAELDHPVRFEALSAEASADHCQNAFAGGEGTYHWVEPYRTLLEDEGWQVATRGSSPYDLLKATRGSLRIRMFVDDPGFRGLTTLRIERR